MSRKSLCFSARIVVNGRDLGTVHNAGAGGPNQYQWHDLALGHRLERAASRLEPVGIKGAKVQYGLDLLLLPLVINGGYMTLEA